MTEIMEMYTRFESELEERIARNRGYITQSQNVIANSEKNVARDLEALAELRRLMEEYR